MIMHTKYVLWCIILLSEFSAIVTLIPDEHTINCDSRKPLHNNTNIFGKSVYA